MFKIEEKQKIGTYLDELIKKKYPSKRKFCQAYIKATNGEVNDEETRKMANRISQITKGAKAIQTYDLPIFTELLEVSCEQILSAGQSCTPQNKRVTNYSIAFSKDEREWEAYIERDDKLILNQDEYGKTVIEYAIEFKNFDFLKYLIDNKYIWFDSRKDMDYVMTFGAGTSIQRRNPYCIDDLLQYRLSTEDQLRLDIVSLAIEHDDLQILEELRARENPQLYCKVHYSSCHNLDFDSCYDEGMVQHISQASDIILNYFTDEFKIRDRIKYKNGSNRAYTFMFPYISKLLDFLIENNSGFTETALKKSIKHNKSTYKKLCELINRLKNDEYYSREFMKNAWIKTCKQDINFYENGDIISFRAFYTYMLTKSSDGIITNIAHVTQKAKSEIIKHLIEELNQSYDKIRYIKNNLKENGYVDFEYEKDE